MDEVDVKEKLTPKSVGIVSDLTFFLRDSLRLNHPMSRNGLSKLNEGMGDEGVGMKGWGMKGWGRQYYCKTKWREGNILQHQTVLFTSEILVSVARSQPC